MAQVIGTVAKLVGVAYARASDGSLREIRVGDDVFDGEVLLTAEGSAVELTIPDAPTILVAGGRELLINGELTLAMRDQAEEASVLDETLEAVVAAL
ncbi:retention module-containing protein, partial [bacterium]|nr:retention module-containing protein [bacterium]